MESRILTLTNGEILAYDQGRCIVLRVIQRGTSLCLTIDEALRLAWDLEERAKRLNLSIRQAQSANLLETI